jgi:hypothetical protein
MSVPRLENCRICGEPFVVTGRLRLCETCRRKLDEVHSRARRKLREDKAKDSLTSLELAEALGEDPIFIQILVEEGLLERREGDPVPDSLNRARLAAEFGEELRRMEGQGRQSRVSGEGMFYSQRRQQDRED